MGIDPSEACRLNDLVVLDVLPNERIVDSFFIGLPLTVRKGCLELAIERGDAAMVEELVAQIQELDPMNIDFAERLLPELRDAGFKTQADESLDQLMKHGQRHLERHGLDATSLNNLAWTAAMNERYLDEALKYSLRACQIEPDSVVYRDTLAEVLHLLGETNQALAIETACLLDEPDEWHLHEQIKKFKQALETAP